MGKTWGPCFFCGEQVIINYSSDPVSGNGIELGGKLICNNCRREITFKDSEDD